MRHPNPIWPFFILLLLVEGCITPRSHEVVYLDTTWEVHDPQPLDRFVVSKARLAKTPVWESSAPFRPCPLQPSSADKIALDWYKKAYPMATDAFVLHDGMRIFQQAGLRRWYYLIMIEVPTNQVSLLPTDAAHIIPVLLDGTVVSPKYLTK